MKHPKTVDTLEWARYNEWLSGASLVVTPAKEYVDVRTEEESADARDSRRDAQHQAVGF